MLRRTVLPLLPPRLRLPFRYRLHVLGGGCEPVLRRLTMLAPPGEIAVDVGANEGLYSLQLARHFAHVYAFEINDELTGDLAAFNPGNITIVHEGLSARPGESVLHIPVQHGRQLTGWASLDPENCPGATELLHKPVHLQPLDAFGLERVAFIKIDVEGHEAEVLQGAVDTLRRTRPRILAEVKERNREAVFELLDRLEYRRYAVDELLATDSASEDFLFVPCEQPMLVAV